MSHIAKKSLGQNFLKSKPALAMMCSAGDVGSTDTIVEIGPGKGALTDLLLSKAKKVFAIEKDNDLVQLLEEKYQTAIQDKKLVLIHSDVLLFDPHAHGIEEGRYKIIANIPYNITGAIIKKFLSETLRPSTMVLLVQKEVAERIVARDHKESILSISVKAYGTPLYIMKVGKRFFSPEPKVDSAIIAIRNINQKYFTTQKEEEAFFTIVKAAFAHKRKVMRNNLESIAPREAIDALYTELGIDPKIRAEDIASPLWSNITKKLEKYLA